MGRGTSGDEDEGEDGADGAAPAQREGRRRRLEAVDADDPARADGRGGIDLSARPGSQTGRVRGEH